MGASASGSRGVPSNDLVEHGPIVEKLASGFSKGLSVHSHRAALALCRVQRGRGEQPPVCMWPYGHQSVRSPRPSDLQSEREHPTTDHRDGRARSDLVIREADLDGCIDASRSLREGPLKDVDPVRRKEEGNVDIVSEAVDLIQHFEEQRVAAERCKGSVCSNQVDVLENHE